LKQAKSLATILGTRVENMQGNLLVNENSKNPQSPSPINKYINPISDLHPPTTLLPQQVNS
jgi:hypothetical protein